MDSRRGKSEEKGGRKGDNKRRKMVSKYEGTSLRVRGSRRVRGSKGGRGSRRLRGR